MRRKPTLRIAEHIDTTGRYFLLHIDYPTHRYSARCTDEASVITFAVLLKLPVSVQAISYILSDLANNLRRAGLTVSITD